MGAEYDVGFNKAGRLIWAVKRSDIYQKAEEIDFQQNLLEGLDIINKTPIKDRVDIRCIGEDNGDTSEHLCHTGQDLANQSRSTLFDWHTDLKDID